jgi:hypothetical protein
MGSVARAAPGHPELSNTSPITKAGIIFIAHIAGMDDTASGTLHREAMILLSQGCDGA